MHRLLLVYTLIFVNFCSYPDTSAAPQSTSIKALRNANLRRDGKRFQFYLFILLTIITFTCPLFVSLMRTVVSALWYGGFVLVDPQIPGNERAPLFFSRIGDVWDACRKGRNG